MFTTKSSHESTSADEPPVTNNMIHFLTDLKVPEAYQWPADKFVRYGKVEFGNLCKRFKLNKAKIINCFQDFIEDVLEYHYKTTHN